MTFTMTPGTYIVAGGGFKITSSAMLQGQGVTVYNTSSAGWGCSATYAYAPISIDGQASVNLSAPTSGPLTGIVLFGDRNGCSTLGACEDIINGQATATFNGVIYTKSDLLVFNGKSQSSGCVAAVADKIQINGDTFSGGNDCFLNSIGITISPQTAALYGGQSQQFTAKVTNTYFTNVNWSISPDVGSIDASGNYTAPPVISAEQTVTVTATSQADTTKSASAVVTLFPPETISVSPTTATVNAGSTQPVPFTATVTNALNTAVTWTVSGGSNPGSVDASGNYTPPATVSGQEQVTVTATSVGDPSLSASATVTVLSPITISVTPPSATLTGGQTAQFTASVSNTTNTAVTWSINPGAGTISSSGLYTAPSSVTSQQSITVTATSVADPTKTASALVSVNPLACASNGYKYWRAIVIDHTKVSGTDQTNFPLLFNTTDPLFATTANGGHVTNANGDDIIFSTDPNGATKLDFQIEKYDPVTGQVIAWIRIPYLSHTADTVLYMFYGNPNVTTSQQNSAGVWDSNYQAVYHLTNIGAGTAQDSTANGNAATLTGVASTTGEFDGGGSFNGTSSYLQIPSAAYSAYPNNFAQSFGVWFKTASAGVILGQTDGTQPNGGPGGWTPALYVDTSGHLRASFFWHGSSGDQIVSAGTYNDNQWHFVVDTYSNGTESLYVDGQPVGSQQVAEDSYSSAYAYFAGTGYTSLWPNSNGSWSYFNGTLDEIRVSNVARSAGWIATAYNDGMSPSSFYSVDAENTEAVIPGSVSLYAGQTQQFSALGVCSSSVQWSISSGAPGSLNSGGLYSAPASIAVEQRVAVTAALPGIATPGTAIVTLLPAPSNPTLTLAAKASPPYVVGTAEQFSATLENQDGTPLPDFPVTFQISGVNPTSGTSTTDSNGVATFTYTGGNSGSDTIAATAAVNGAQVPSNAVQVSWLLPVQTISSTTVTGEFFQSDGSGPFNTPPAATPAFTEVFPTIDFNPPTGTVPNTPSDINVCTRPFTDVTTDINGNFTGSIVAEGNGYQAGGGPSDNCPITSSEAMFTFQAVFRGSFTVKSAGNVVFNFYNDDGFIFGIGNGATRVSGASTNMPTTTPFEGYPTMGSYNIATGPIGNQVVVNFPVPGTYPYEVDYSECCGDQLVLTMTQGASSPTGVPPTGSLEPVS